MCYCGDIVVYHQPASLMPFGKWLTFYFLLLRTPNTERSCIYRGRDKWMKMRQIHQINDIEKKIHTKPITRIHNNNAYKQRHSRMNMNTRPTQFTLRSAVYNIFSPSQSLSVVVAIVFAHSSLRVIVLMGNIILF